MGGRGSGTQSLALRPQQMADEQGGCRETRVVDSQLPSVRDQRGATIIYPDMGHFSTAAFFLLFFERGAGRVKVFVSLIRELQCAFPYLHIAQGDKEVISTKLRSLPYG